MSGIGVLIGDMFEDAEYTRPRDAFKAAGHIVVHVGIDKRPVKGREGLVVPIDRTLKEAKAQDFDALFIPGGYSPDKLRANDDAVRFTKDFAGTGKPILFICHGAQLLVTADLLHKRKVTGYKSIIRDIQNAGAEFLDKEVVIDGNFVSSRDKRDIPAFVKASLDKLAQA